MNATATAPTLSPLELHLERIRQLHVDGQHAQALQAAEALLIEAPGHYETLYLAARSQRYLGQIEAALKTLARMEQQRPPYSRMHEERGHCYVVLRDAPRAIDALLLAVNINPALPSSWNLLEGLYRMTGDAANAATAASHVATLKLLAPDVVRATSHFSDGELDPAEQIIRAYLLKAGNDVEAMRLLARIGVTRDALDDAETLLEAVLKIAPDYRAARYDYACVLLERHLYMRACEGAEKLLAIDPDHLDYRALYARASVGLGEHDRAITLYKELLQVVPGAADLHLSLAHSLKTQGRQAESVVAYRTAATVRPDFGDAFWSLANLKTYRFSDEEIARMRAAEAAPTSQTVDRYHLCFALGKAFEDRGDYAGSWRYYSQGNALKRSESRYRAEIIEINTRKQIEVCTREFFASRAGAGAQRPDPIFIVGLPRAGSTLIEQILASHSRVEGTHELGEIPRIVLDLQGRQPDLDNPRYPGALAELTPEDFRRLGEKYLGDTQIYRGNQPYFIDKMPNNFRHIGLIHLILPNAKIIDVRREPIACCFSNLKQLFATGQEFSYSVDDIARYYRTYLDVMQHWNEVLPGRVLRVHHEDVVDDLESNVRRILDFCGLPFESSCLEFYKTARSVRTASSEQVRQPIFRDGVDQWRNYGPWLGPLKDALGDALVRYR
ncbi:tetratricopeptide repeat-containing sulfotransferase family protein [Rhodanobacter sp. MP7CTX1]|uniref:tetratricopeptide repeat-containing sulfotransferase family protein n=1 Tax=Rhodanobacter sp. MP7CTX1 TaxID=2723084 RepID=UPI00161E1754|nr:tetratricopeptide repeat-containing sulfotransferase family protein [Rhodanobacter sp. MP7CTX1]MBB6187649.1 tetratricopeptide (TPR) repeat protein [Rhodanobacter sp. MP7CTX1]